MNSVADLLARCREYLRDNPGERRLSIPLFEELIEANLDALSTERMLLMEERK